METKRLIECDDEKPYGKKKKGTVWREKNTRAGGGGGRVVTSDS